MAKKVTKKGWVAKKNGYKSGLEDTVSQQIESMGIKTRYKTKSPWAIYIADRACK